MIQGISSLFAIAANSVADETRSSALPYAISCAAAAGAHLTAHSVAIRLVLPSAAGSGTISGPEKDQRGCRGERQHERGGKYCGGFRGDRGHFRHLGLAVTPAASCVLRLDPTSKLSDDAYRSDVIGLEHFIFG